jgi:hypothetical protein
MPIYEYVCEQCTRALRAADLLLLIDHNFLEAFIARRRRYSCLCLRRRDRDRRARREDSRVGAAGAAEAVAAATRFVTSWVFSFDSRFFVGGDVHHESRTT